MRPPDFWSRPTPGWQTALLAPAAAAYRWAGRLRQTSVTPHRAGIPVLCVGNLTLGGTGKTPIAIALGGIAKASGHTPFFLTRGYGGTLRGPVRVDPALHLASDVGDEPLLLAEAAPVIVARDRVAGAQRALHDGASLIIMDDGFQNPALAKDMSLIVIDGEAGFGNGAVFPAGPLRETVAQGLARAQGIVVVEGARPSIDETAFDPLPVFHASLAPDPHDADMLRGQMVFAFAGIGRPEKFFATLRACGAVVADTRSFPDHFPFAQGEVAALHAQAKALGARLVTTQKDYVRLPPPLRAGIATLRVSAAFSDYAGIAKFIATL